MQVEAHFPLELEELAAKSSLLASYQASRQKLTVELAEQGQVIRELTILAESGRMMGDV